MTRVKRSNVAKKRRQYIFSITSGAKRARSKLYRTAQQQAMKSLSYSFTDRKKRKRYFRSLWITRINAFARSQALSYSRLLHQLYQNNILLNRKMLAQIAVYDESSFLKIIPNSILSF
jgi:large subunit ribosomal protein L20